MSDLKMWDRLFEILHQSDPDLDLYVYRVDTRGKRVRPYLFRTFPDRSLLATLRDEYGGGTFDIMIREGNMMVLSGRFSIGVPLAMRER